MNEDLQGLLKTIDIGIEAVNGSVLPSTKDDTPTPEFYFRKGQISALNSVRLVVLLLLKGEV